ncbi:uncharacterized protein VTP21DRAFT_7287 [Calcarisporiella thermophila]|uniref:uncharacterized protein n=1 Tax=Calcarisporiella thermophila TaxID=911321 RepID=UPI003742FCC1
MEILRYNFQDYLPRIKQILEECDFIAIDTELSGLHKNPIHHKITRHDSLEQRYVQVRVATSSYLVLQIGICPFRWDSEQGAYIAYPFNFYIFPSGSESAFMCKPTALEFLSKNGFDFNKWVYNGIPYLTLEQESELREKKMRIFNSNLPDIRIDPKEESFIENSIKDIESWLEKEPDISNCLNIATKNSYQRRLLYQIIRTNFPQLDTEGRQGFIRIIPSSQELRQKKHEERMEALENDIIKAKGFRYIIDIICHLGKPIIGHNFWLDLCHIYAQFVKPLPAGFSDCKRALNQLFPFVYDTKYICASEKFKCWINDSNLVELEERLHREPFTEPKIEINVHHCRYSIQNPAHEAGYDAFMTGVVFLKLAGFLHSPPDEKTEKTIVEKDIANESVDAEDIPMLPVSECTSYVEYENEDNGEKEEGEWTEDEWSEDDNTMPTTVEHPSSQPLPLFDSDLLKPFLNRLNLSRNTIMHIYLEGDEDVSPIDNVFHLFSLSESIHAPELQTYFGSFGNYEIEWHQDSECFITFEQLTLEPTEVMLKVREKMGADRVFEIETLSEWRKRMLESMSDL